MEMEKVFNRKKELIQRDPLYWKALKTLKKIAGTGEDVAFQEIPRIGIQMRKNGYPEEAIRSREVQHEKQNPDAWKLFKQMGGVEYKWQVSLKPEFSSKEISIMAPYTNPEIIWVGTPPLTIGHEDLVMYDPKFYPQLYWLPYPNPFKKAPILFEINEIYRMRGKWIPFIIDVSRLNRNDERAVKKLIWSIIENNLQKERTKKPHDEFKECGFLYHLRDEKTFQNYLRWYDLHFEKPHFTFRAIAFIEYVFRNYPDKYESTMTEIAKRTKIVRTARGERILKGVVGEHIKGEDAVEKGVKLIYSAIHRKPYLQKTKQRDYNCPTHGVSCPTMECPYLKSFMKDYNRRNVLFLPLHTTDPRTLSQVIGEDSPEDSGQ